MRLARVDQALEHCERHLDLTKSFGTEIESLITSSLLVLICAEFEQRVKAIIEERCNFIPDGALREFVGSCVDAVFRSVRSSEIAGLLNRFGRDYGEAFKEKTDANPKAVTLYNNIVTNRNTVAHSTGGNMTFAEIKSSYGEGHVVLDFFRETLFTVHPTQSE